MEGSPIDRAFFMGLLVIGLAVVIVRMDRVGPLLRSNGSILLFFSFCAVSILWSDFPLVALKRWTKSLGDLVMVLIILTEPDPMGALKQLITRLGFILFPLSILFGKYYPHVGRRLTNSWTGEIIGVTTQKNSLGVIACCTGSSFCGTSAQSIGTEVTPTGIDACWPLARSSRRLYGCFMLAAP